MNYIYSELGDAAYEVEYEGVDTDYAKTSVDNDKRTITVSLNLELKDLLPELPTDDGAYLLKLSVVDGKPTFSWLLDTKYNETVPSDTFTVSESSVVRA